MDRQIPAWLVVSLSLALTGCGLPTVSPAPQSGSPVISPETSSTATQPTAAKSLKIVATVLPMYWFTKAVVGDTAQVSLLVAPTAAVHDYQATPDNVRAIAEANVLVKNGLGLEEFLDATIANAGNPKLTLIDATKGIKALGAISPVVAVGEAEGGDEPGHAEAEAEAQESETESEKSHADHHHAAGNPHVWIDPVIAQQQVAAIRDGLIAAAPENRAIYEANAAAYIQQLQDLHTKYLNALQPYQGCAFITFHDAYPYLAQRYQLRQVAVVSIPEDNLSPAEIKQTIDAVRQYKVKALFGEPGVDNKLLQSLAQDLNLTLRPIDPLERGNLDLNYYFQVMEQNLQTLTAACQGKAN